MSRWRLPDSGARTREPSVHAGRTVGLGSVHTCASSHCDGMLLVGERTDLIHHALQMQRDGLSTGTAGNLSARNGGLVAITPSGIPYDELTPSCICIVDLDGEQVEDGPRPSSELPLHLAIYRDHAAGAVIHTHSPHATAVSVVLDELPPIHYLAGELGGSIRVAPYATFGSEELAAAASSALAGRHAALLAAHGTVTTGQTLSQAYARSLQLEWLARLYALASAIGKPRVLPADEIVAVNMQLEALAYGPSRRGPLSLSRGA